MRMEKLGELRAARRELEQIDEQLRLLKTRRKEIQAKINQLQELAFSNSSDYKDYEKDDFEWSATMMTTCATVFNIKSFRMLQKAAINATMCGVDCLLIMPTGGGKSLCFQLPALLKPGVTIVISPLISLMEDQLRSMQELDIETIIFNAQSDKDESKMLMQKMVDPACKLRLVYITPEKLAKSKRFMAQLEKMYSLGRFSRLVIDEVHCCSQWGHDFRQDYKFLGIMKNQFPEVPILGLTATATKEVIKDIQKILNIEGCLVLKDSFYRPNLRYQVIYSNTKDDSEKIAELIKTEFNKKCGIIYCLTVKETDELAKKLVTHNIRACSYHAQLEPATRKKYQEAWYKGVISVIVATIAFGMGINKLDVRFVIHYSMSKSLENYYQETGRAGRDGKEARCILYYRFQDAFRTTSLFFAESSASKIIYQMIKFCNNRISCRKKLLAQYFGDADCVCNKMCDNCCDCYVYQEIDARRYYLDILKILNFAEQKKERVTPLKLIEAWLGKGSKKIRPDNIEKPKYTREACESILVHLILENYLKEEFHFTPYTTISYIVRGYKQLYGDGPLKIKICVPGEGVRESAIQSSSSLLDEIVFDYDHLSGNLDPTTNVTTYNDTQPEPDDSDPIIPRSKKPRTSRIYDLDKDESSDEIICDAIVKPSSSYESNSLILLD